MSETSSLMNITAQQYLMKKAVEAPEDIYAAIQEAEAWVEELKKIARDKLIAKMPKEAKTFDIDTPNHVIHTTRNRGKFKPNKVHEVLTKLNIPTVDITYLKPLEYGVKPGAFEILEQYLKDKILTQAQFDSMFGEGNYTVTLKPKSALTVALNSQNGE